MLVLWCALALLAAVCIPVFAAMAIILGVIAVAWIIMAIPLVLLWLLGRG